MFGRSWCFFLANLLLHNHQIFLLHRSTLDFTEDRGHCLPALGVAQPRAHQGSSSAAFGSGLVVGSAVFEMFAQHLGGQNKPLTKLRGTWDQMVGTCGHRRRSGMDRRIGDGFTPEATASPQKPFSAPKPESPTLQAWTSDGCQAPRDQS